jgi:hypothetical protein
MGEEKLIKAYSKLINSDVLKSIYPMLDHIDIFLNDSSIDKNNMYVKDFDPHYLVEKHLKDLSKYLGLEFHRITFKLFGPDRDLILNWD